MEEEEKSITTPAVGKDEWVEIKLKENGEEEVLANIIEIVIDRSGSMSSMGNGTVEQIQKLLLEQKKTAEETKIPTRISLTTFDDKVDVRLENVRLDLDTSLPKYQDLKDWLQPRGLTRLIDTALERLKCLEKNVKLYRQQANKTGKIIQNFMLLTDGEDNMSKENSETLRTRLENIRREEKDFTAFFLGANQDAIKTGQGYGFEESTSLTFEPHQNSVSHAIQSTSRAIKMRSLMPCTPSKFTDTDRSNASK